jgi:signal transduction histidine kinase
MGGQPAVTPPRLPGRLLLVAELAACPTQVAEARRRTLEALPPTCTTPGPVLTVVSELVANAITHTELPCRLRIRLLSDPPCVRIEVTDPCPSPPKLVEHDVLDQAGRGLVLVERTAQRWGWTPAGTGKTVWAELSPP